MGIESIALGVVSGVLVLLAVGFGVWWLAQRSREGSAPRFLAPKSQLDGQDHRPFRGTERGSAHEVVVAEGDQEVMSIRTLDEPTFLERSNAALRLDPKCVSGVLEPVLQVMPTVANAVQAGGRRLMEVSIRGDLVRAADGNGFRAFARDSKGIVENARLYPSRRLQAVAAGAVIWQIGSIAFAQAHLADIGAAIRRVDSRLKNIEEFQEGHRFAVVQAAMKYLRDAYAAIQEGDFSSLTRHKLEDFEIELSRVTSSLVKQINHEAGKPLEQDFAGCRGEFDSAMSKQQKLQQLVSELGSCSEARMVNWYVCALYPESSKVLKHRLEQIGGELTSAKVLAKHLSDEGGKDAKDVKADWTREEVERGRQQDVEKAVAKTGALFQESNERCEEIFNRLVTIVDGKRGTSRLLVESRNGVPSAVYLTHDQVTVPHPIQVRAERVHESSTLA